MPDKEELERLAQLEERMIRNQQRFEQMAKKSFILNQSKQTEDVEDFELLKRVERTRQEQMENITLQRFQFTSRDFWRIVLKRNYDLLAWMLLDVSTNLFLYAVDTIKCRTQAKNKFRDISHFDLNKAQELSLYRGVQYRMAQIIFGGVIRNFFQKLRYSFDNDSYLITRILTFSIIQESVITSLLLPFEIKKLEVQLGTFKKGFNPFTRAYPLTVFPAIVRDTLFFLTHSMTYNTLLYGEYFVSSLFRQKEFIPPTVIPKGERERKYSAMLLSIAISIIVTNPFDVLISKMATQKQVYIYYIEQIIYTNPIQAFNVIRKEEGYAKLAGSAISSRFAYYALKGLIFFNYQEKVTDLCYGAFYDV
ncbi:hypothetical protein pb186bvf_015777 [Paramecium bursaria]